jgi:hypothetical protein
MDDDGIKGLQPVAKVKGAPPADWGQVISRWRGQLEKLAGEFVAAEAAVAPQPGSCQRCDLQPLCRIAAAGENTA